MDELYKLATNFGFPVAVTAFLLIKIEKQLDQMNQTLIRLINSLPKDN